MKSRIQNYCVDAEILGARSPIYPSIHLRRYSPFWVLAFLRRSLHSFPSFARLPQSLWYVPSDDVLPSCSCFSHWSLFTTKFPTKNLSFFFLGGGVGILSSSILTTYPTHLSLLILISSTAFRFCTNNKRPYSNYEARVLYVVLGRNFLTFPFLSFVLEFMLQFHNAQLLH